MTPDVVVDVGNTRVKWGRCTPTQVLEVAALPPVDPAAWQRQAETWGLPSPSLWVLTGVHPDQLQGLEGWLRTRGDRVVLLNDPQLMPLRVLLERPDHVGADRLLDAVAANHRRPAGVPAAVVDAGSAVTVDWVDETGAFRGGAILPGFRLMAQTLHDYTALLPLVEVPRQVPPLLGTSTPAAMQSGIFRAVAGGIRLLLEEFAAGAVVPPVLFLTGGDGPVLHPVLGPGIQLWPTMTLEGIRLAAEALP